MHTGKGSRDEPPAAPARHIGNWFQRHWGEQPLRLYLAILAIVGGLPMFLFAILLLVELQAAARQSEASFVVERANEIRSDLDRDLDAALQLVAVLARSEALRRLDYPSFYQEAQSVATRAGGIILLLEPDQFGQILNTLVPFGTVLPPTAAPEAAHEALRSGKPLISSLFMGKVSKQWVFNVVHPVLDDGVARSVLVLSFPAGRLHDRLKRDRLPSGWVASVADGQGRVVARFPDNEPFVGLPAPFSFLAESAAVSVKTDDGKGLGATSRSRLSDWKVYVWVPDAVIRAPFREVWVWLLAVGISLISLTVVLALYGGGWIQSQIGDVAAAAEAVGRGAIPSPLTTPLREANTVHRALAVAAARIAEARENVARLAVVPLVSGEAIYSMTREGTIESWNLAAEALFGYSADEAIGRSASILLPPNCAEQGSDVMSRVAAGERVTIETIRCRKNGQCFAVAISLAPVPDENNRVSAFVAVARDISERKARDDQVQSLVRELSHRSKNLLTVVQSLARLTGQNCPNLAVFQERFLARLQAYAATYDALVKREWQGANFDEIIKVQLSPLLPKAGDRYTADGPDLLIAPAAAESIGLALHELGTNALKYGALSNETGHVRIGWRVEPSGQQRTIVMEWQESGGPTITQPITRGFGSVVVTELVEHRTDGKVTLIFAADGVRWTLVAPLAGFASSVRRIASQTPEPAG